MACLGTALLKPSTPSPATNSALASASTSSSISRGALAKPIPSVFVAGHSHSCCSTRPLPSNLLTSALQLRSGAAVSSPLCAVSARSSSLFCGRKLAIVSAPVLGVSGGSRGRATSPGRRTLIIASVSPEPGDGSASAAAAAATGGGVNGPAAVLTQAEELELRLREMEERLAAAEAAAAAAAQEKASALEAAAAAEAKAEAYAAKMVATTEEAMAEVRAAKESFQAELERVEREKGELEEALVAAQAEGLDLAMKVEKMASIAVQEQTSAITEEAKLKIAAAKAEAAEIASQMESKIRIAADEAAAAVIEEAKATIEDAIAAAEIAKEQARAAEVALAERLGVLDTLGATEVKLMETEDANAALRMKLMQAENEKENLRMEIKAVVARAEAAEARILTTQAAVAEVQALAERTAKEREQSTERALEAMRLAAEGREKAAALAYKAETDSLKAAALAAQKAERVKEQAMSRRFTALQRSLTAAEEATRMWRERCLAVEELLSLIKEKGFNVLREAGEVEDLLNRGRMDVMLGEQSSEKWKILAEGPRKDRPDWLLQRSPLKAAPPVPAAGSTTAATASKGASVPLELPLPEEVWSIAEHQVADDVFTREAEKRELEAREIEEKRKQLEQTLQRKAAPAKRVRSPEELEEALESGTGTGREIVFQGFNWESNKKQWYLEMAPRAADLAACGITTVWLPPPTESVSPEGYMPVDYYNLNSKYGTKEQLQFCIDELHNHDLLVLGDVVLNHRCASKQNKEGIWNIFGGKLAWGPEAIVCDDPNFHGHGNPSSGDFFHAAPNVDHSQDFVRRDIKDWLRWLRAEVGYDGWRLDFVRGFWGGYVKEYIEASNPAFCIGEYWDSLAYDGGNPSYNQNAHRQRIINWINATGGTSSAFDVTTKGILHSALHNEYWRLIDPQGKPPGVMGWWPSRAVTFLENHDTGSTQAHWPFPREKLMQGYAYILTHPGTPVVFYDHFYDFGLHDQIAELIAARNHCGIHCRSPVKIFHANAQGYVAMVGEELVVKLGHFDWNPSRQNDLMGRWEKIMDKGGDYILWKKE